MLISIHECEMQREREKEIERERCSKHDGRKNIFKLGLDVAVGSSGEKLHCMLVASSRYRSALRKKSGPDKETYFEEPQDFCFQQLPFVCTRSDNQMLRSCYQLHNRA